MKTYIKPTIALAQLSTEHFIAASVKYEPNKVTDDGDGIYTGGYSGVSDNQDNGNGSIEDMAKKHNFNAWSTWDE